MYYHSYKLEGFINTLRVSEAIDELAAIPRLLVR